MLTPLQQLDRSLSGTATVQVTHLYGLGREAISAADIQEWPFAQIIETMDTKTCPLCRSVHGLILAKTDPRYHEWKYPSHIGCRRVMVDIGRGERGDDGKPLTPTFTDPDKDLLEKHGHFNVDPDKYAALRIPSRPEGRDFIYVPGKGGGPHKLIWRPGLSDDARRATIQDMMSEVLRDPETLAKSGDLLRQLGTWAAEEADFASLDAVFSAAREDWPALSEGLQLAELAWRLASDPKVQVFVIESLGAMRVAYYSPEVRLSGQVSAHDVVLILNPLTGQLVDLRSRPLEWFTTDPIP